jgi:serine/threonine-protein kinase
MSGSVKNWAFGLKGKILGGRYVLGDVIGVGGMGAVFQGVHMKMGRPVAVKLLVPDLSEDRETSLRFQQEARAAAQIARKGVVEILDFDDDQELGSFLVMELLRGEALSKRIKRRGKLEVVEALSIGLQVADALASVHSKGIVHRDLKPANVYLAMSEEGDEVVKLLDFGISRVLASSKANQLTKPGVLLGTPRYMSPEQAWCKPDVDHRTDLYAIGAILYHALSGVKPYQELPPGKLLEAVLKREPQPLREICPDLPASVYSLIGRSMERERTARFQTADELRACFMASLEELARANAVVTVDTAEESSTFLGAPLQSLSGVVATEPLSRNLGETVAMEPTSSSLGETIAFEPTAGERVEIGRVLSIGGAPDARAVPASKPVLPGAPQAPVVRFETPAPDELGRTTVGGYQPPSSPITKAGYPELGGPTVAFDSGAYHSAQVSQTTPSSEQDLIKTTVAPPASEQRPSRPPATAIGIAPASFPQAVQPPVSEQRRPSRPPEPAAAVEPEQRAQQLPQPAQPLTLDQRVNLPSGSFDSMPVPGAPPRKRSVGKIVVLTIIALVVLAGAALGGLWLAVDQGWVRDPGFLAGSGVRGSRAAGNGPTKRTAAGPERPGAATSPGSGPATPPGGTEPPPPQGRSQVEQWRSEIQIARNEREVGQGARARERLLAVVAAVEQARPARDSQEAQAGVEACLLLGEIDMMSIGTGAIESIAYLAGVAAQIQTVTQTYQRAWRLGVNQLEQCVYEGMARAAEHASEACGRAASSPGLDALEVARRRAEAQRYLAVARDHFQRAQNVRDSECRDQVAAGLARVNAVPAAPLAPDAPPAPVAPHPQPAPTPLREGVIVNPW